MKTIHKLAALGVGALVVTPTGALRATTEPTPEPIAVELLTPRSTFTDGVAVDIEVTLDGQVAHQLDIDDPTHTVVAKITAQPGARFPWHTHAGPVIVNIAQGELVYIQASDCIERHYAASTVFVDPGRGNVHTAYNASDGETIFFATFFEAPADGPLTITEGIETPTDCDVEVGSHLH